MAGTTSTPAAVEATAHWTAAVRTAKSEREDRLFADPWAAALAGPEGRDWIATRTPESVQPMVLRTRFFDDWLGAVVRDVGATAGASGGPGVPVAGRPDVEIRQVVLVAAGLDTRAYRLDWPLGTRIFELDRPAVLAYKDGVLAGIEPSCDRRTVPADLGADWARALVDAGFEPGTPSAWLLEGLLFYLPSEVIARVLDEVDHLSAPGGRLGFDIINGEVLRSPYTRAWIEMQAASGAPWIGSMEDPRGFLAERGWDAHLTQYGEPEADHGRWRLPVLPPAMPGMPRNWLVTATKG